MHETSTSCKNCNKELTSGQNYCPECGQNTDIHRINFHFLLHEVQHGIFHVDGGILYTIKELFTRPGHSIREYLEGKRKKHFKPVLLIMILGTITALINHWILGRSIFVSSVQEKELQNLEKAQARVTKSGDADQQAAVNILSKFTKYFMEGSEWVNSHYAITMLFLIPIFALGLYLGFKKYKINFWEWLVACTFMTAQTMIVLIVSNLLSYFFGDTMNLIFFIIAYVLIFWTMIQFFYESSKIEIIARTLISIILMYIVYMMLIIAIVLVLVFISLK